MPQPLLLERGIRSPLNIACRLLNREVYGAPAGSMVRACMSLEVSQSTVVSEFYRALADWAQQTAVHQSTSHRPGEASEAL